VSGDAEDARDGMRGTPSAETVLAIPGFDSTKPNVARVYDALLGGKDNFAADRDEAARLLTLNPYLGKLARQNRIFLGRAVHWLAAECGIRQYLDLGSGLPADGNNTHEVVQAVSADCRVTYVDVDPVAVLHATALLAKGDSVQAVHGDLADSAAVLSAEKVRGTMDPDEPVAVILAMVLHFFPQETAARIVAEYAAAIAPGSYVVISCGTSESNYLAPAYKPGTLHNHPPERIAGFFGDLEPVDPPGLVDARLWLPGQVAGTIPSLAGSRILAGVARKPL